MNVKTIADLLQLMKILDRLSPLEAAFLLRLGEGRDDD